MRLLPFGDAALLVEFDGLEQTLAAYRGLVVDRIDGVEALVPAARTVLVRIDTSVLSLTGAERWIRGSSPRAADDGTGSLVRIPVRYDGADLADTARHLGLSVADLIARHTGHEWVCAFIGFAPGFGYLTSDAGLNVPRLETSRPVVPAGAVGLAGEFSGVYPRSSPGGWRLIGTTDARLWDPDRPEPSLLAPGTRVRFEEVRS
ncbi:allophanate hydrolase subunit 1 [Herbiconiux sp. L3-i23]|uniref:5-oxoprolinase subunit B family protein n=1 Tax=Herbiconiux sp. L3-i23 TaxID=2905871 RepID=UPI00205ED79D|nr:allophanate hydrolase subunit 1 [Herbiconiux sp. L3-i23]BDI23776.1 hypothetical protein L3i23_25520 [Herbiconiux sp. L3-i23]